MWGKVLASNGVYRLIEGIGRYMERRYEVQKRYSYIENGEQVTSYHMVCYSTDLEMAKMLYKLRVGGIENGKRHGKSSSSL